MFTKPDAIKVVCNASKIYHKKLANKNSSDFYRKCLSNNLSEDDFTFKEDGTTDLKLKALPQIINFFQMSKMTTLYSNTLPRLYRKACRECYCLCWFHR